MAEIDQDDHAGALAEYSALRNEITTRISLQHQVLALHVTAVSVVFSVALAGRSRWPVLLIISFISYASSEILASLFRTIEGIAKYIDEELSQRVAGGLGWESWLVQHKPASETARLTHPYYLLFPGISIVSLVAIGAYAWSSSPDGRQSASFWTIISAWPLAAVFAALSFRAVRRLRAPF
ncbi:hypothetical protein J8N05_35115 [Streptomyces sp. BH-SS-21]|uniref:Uncharacterized protein n=1 Tax=Streptomyces liliiviolaceus TaxID=2823109 RepID=A0A940XWZ2_9ACTN|nr:hypothetical protein [Streptomyces liliiviolaceus]MBQ0853399.1 hypothetical protein [Streptomyces liliiviolaceus]